MMKVTWNKIFRAFEEKHPDLRTRGTKWVPYDYAIIKIWMPGIGVALYHYDLDEFQWLAGWSEEVNLKEKKRLEKEARPGMYDRFCRIVTEYLDVNNMTHQQFADMVDLSRRSLSRYLNGDRIPKVSTMRRICEVIGVDL